jgi:septum formation protein
MVFGIPDNFRFILASRSPRRQELLKEAGFVFEVKEVDYDEGFPETLKGKEIAEYLSLEKAHTFEKKNILPSEVIITADTIVWCNNRVLDKPKDYKEAFDILTMISGNTHEVITGVTFLSSCGIHTFSETTIVKFDTLSDEEIDYYIRNCKPFDKAGAYGIQEWIGVVGNSYLEGSYFNVMGLPVQRLIKELRQFLKQ